MKWLVKAFRLWRIYAWMDWVWLTRDFKFFFINYLADLVISASGVTLTLLMAERFAGIGPWSRDRIIFMLGYAMAVRGLAHSLFGFNVLHISRRLGRGQLDHSLIQPQPLWLTLLTEGFTPFTGSGTIFAGLGLQIWAGFRLGLPWTGLWIGRWIVDSLLSVFIILLFSFAWGGLAFWAPRSAEEVSTAANRLFERLQGFPLDGVGPGARVVLLTCLPVGLSAWYPAGALLADRSEPAWPEGAWMAVLTAAFALLVFIIFKGGLNYYEQVGSKRYSGWGHRS